MDRRAASSHIRSRYPACQAIHIGVIPSATMVPNDEHIAGGRIILNRPNNEIRQNTWIARVGFPKIINHVAFEVAAFSQEITVRLAAGGASIKLCDNVQSVGLTDFFHLVKVGNSGRVEVVIAGEIDHDGPGFFLHVFKSGWGGGFRRSKFGNRFRGQTPAEPCNELDRGSLSYLAA